jgi:C4-dicarboxylate transporter
MAMFDGLLLLALYVLAQGLTAWAFVDALIRPAAGFVAAGKLTKPGWAVITGLAALIIFWQQSPMTLFGLPSVIAAIVYLVDVRPAVRGLRRGNSW